MATIKRVEYWVSVTDGLDGDLIEYVYQGNNKNKALRMYNDQTEPSLFEKVTDTFDETGDCVDRDIEFVAKKDAE